MNYLGYNFLFYLPWCCHILVPMEKNDPAEPFLDSSQWRGLSLKHSPEKGEAAGAKRWWRRQEQWDLNSRKSRASKPSKVASCSTVEAAAAKQLQSSKRGKNAADWERQQERAESQGWRNVKKNKKMQGSREDHLQALVARRFAESCQVFRKKSLRAYQGPDIRGLY